MALTRGRFTWQVSVTTGTNVMRWTEDIGGGSETILETSLGAGTYDTPESLITAVTAAMTTASTARGNGYNYTGAISDTGKAGITVDTGAMGVSTYSEGTTIGYIVGFDASTTTGSTVTADYQHHGGFYFLADGPDLADKAEWSSERTAPMSVCEDGTIVQRPIGSTREMCTVTIANMPKDSAYSSANRDQSLEDLYDFVVAGNSRGFRWYEDVSDTSSWTTVHWDPGTSEMTYDPARDDPGIERWSISMKLRKHV